MFAELFCGLLASLAVCRAAPRRDPVAAQPASISPSYPPSSTQHRGRRLQGRFLHITDIHPDPFYKVYSSTESEAACHRRRGPAGVYGAETSACDTPYSLINETFAWIEEHLKDTIDFVVWTGDSARHDNDEKIPRTHKQIIEQNEFVVDRVRDVFGASQKDRPAIPVVPTFGNNDVMPHNIFVKGPNKWSMKYLDIWRDYIPEEQRHSFQEGGWFYVEVIPNRLAVFSLNTLYFFDSNSAVNGCANKHEPGYEHMEWLRIQLRIMRERGMKVILTGHVPPARTHSKRSWDETCWQKYTLWQRQYRDVIITSLFGHMNIDHFMLHDFNHLKRSTKKGQMAILEDTERVSMLEDGEVTVASASDYLTELGDVWAELPSPNDTSASKGNGGGKKKHRRRVGGRYRQRFSVSHVAPSVIPTYFPTIRVYSYNISGLEDSASPLGPQHPKAVVPDSQTSFNPQEPLADDSELGSNVDELVNKKKDKDEKNAGKRKKYKFKVPDPPSRSAPPGPAYSPQPLTLLGYVQYFANLTEINNDFVPDTLPFDDHPLEGSKWKEGKHGGHQGKQPRPKPHPKPFYYQVEYNTTDDKLYRLKDMTVRSYFDLARRIGLDKSGKSSALPMDEDDDEEDIYEEEDMDEEEEEEDYLADEDGYEEDGERENDSENEPPSAVEVTAKPRHGQQRKSGPWNTFIQRAFVGTMDASDLRKVSMAAASKNGQDETVAEIVEL